MGEQPPATAGGLTLRGVRVFGQGTLSRKMIDNFSRRLLADKGREFFSARFTDAMN